MTDIARIWKVPCRRCGCHVDVNLDEGLKLFEVSDPIVWDGSDAALEAIRGAVSTALGCVIVAGSIGTDVMLFSDKKRTIGIILDGGSVRIEGDSFVILPPEEVQS